MLRHNITRVVVVAEDERPLGVITQKDVVRAMSSTERGIENILAEEIMSSPPITVTPDTPVSKVAEKMLESNISSLIVVDDEGKVLGIVTKTDLCKYFAAKFKGKVKVRDFMTKSVVSVSRSTSVYRVIDLMTKYRIDRVVVVENREPVGIITARDLVFGVHEFKRRGVKYVRRVERSWGYRIYRKVPLVLLAEDLMSSPPIVAKESDDLAQATEIMLREGISGLPVVDAEGKLSGIVTKTDIARALASMR